ncbi:MAG: lytic transglycosylase domain-containing protein [Vicinamibacterales bacterium]
MLQSTPAAQDALPRPDFATWLAAVREEAIARGIREDVVARAFKGLEPLPVVVERDQAQPEFTLTIDQYLARRLTPALVRRARQQFRSHATVLERAQARFGVDAATIVSIWALESNFGRFSGIRPTVATLATLAYDPRRSTLFREELFHALQIVDRGDVTLERLRGSWAGAMGQPQFMPSSFQRYAIDFDGDSRKDIWTSTSDVIGSIANYLKGQGWVEGQRWGRRVRLPDIARVAELAVPRSAGCRAVRGLSEPRPLDEWRRAGVTLANGAMLPTSSQLASLLEVDSQSYLVYLNYEAILGYNCAHAYALSVAQLADRIAGR